MSQTEQASIQAAFSLVRTLSGMYAPLYFTNHYFNTSWTSEPHLLTRPLCPLVLCLAGLAALLSRCPSIVLMIDGALICPLVLLSSAWLAWPPCRCPSIALCMAVVSSR